MQFSTKKIVPYFLLFGGLLAVVTLPAVKASTDGNQPTAFRIATDVYADATKPPVMQTLTLFSEGVYYDFEESEGGLITVVDPLRKRIVLLNRLRQVKTELTLERIQLTVADARTQADAKITAVRDTSYETGRDGVSVAIIRNDFMEYRAEAQAVPKPDIAVQYADFADWSARLNAVTPAKLPPYLRIDLNRLMAGHGTIPSKIERRTHQGGREVVITARLIPNWRLSQDDQTRIARCGAMMAEFRNVPESEYWTPPPVVQASAQTNKK